MDTIISEEQQAQVDVVIPLAGDTTGNFEELKYCLRSIDKNVKDLGQVYILGPYQPRWLQRAKFLYIDDPHKRNKDANIINKVLTAIRVFNLGNFIFWSDDQVLIQETYLGNMPPVYNIRPPDAFRAKEGNRWHARVGNTFDYLESRDIHLPYNYESHVPQRYDGQKVLEVMKDVDYGKLPGYSINTLFMGLLGVTGGINQNAIKATSEANYDNLTQLNDRILFYGYDTAGFKLKAREMVSKMFPDKCRFEL